VFDAEAMGICWVYVNKIYSFIEVLQSKKEDLHSECWLLMATILKISPSDFLEQNLNKFL